MTDIYIAGAAMTVFGRHWDRSLGDLSREALEGALKDAAGQVSDIGVAYYSGMTNGPLQGQHAIPGQVVLSKLGIDSIGKPDTRRASLSFNVDSGVQITRSFDVQGRYTRGTTDQDFRGSGQSRTLAVTWPDLQAKWDGLGNFRPLKPILTNGSVNMNYKATHAESGVKGQAPVSTSDALVLSPAVDMTWKNQMQTTLSVSYSSSSNDTRGSKSETNSEGVSLDLKRDFRGGGGIGFLGKSMSWNNDLETSLSLTYSRAGGQRTVLGGFAEPIPSSSSWRVFPTARYAFTKNVNGSAFIDYSRQYTEATKQTTTTVRVGVTAVVTF